MSWWLPVTGMLPGEAGNSARERDRSCSGLGSFGRGRDLSTKRRSAVVSIIALLRGSRCPPASSLEARPHGAPASRTTDFHVRDDRHASPH